MPLISSPIPLRYLLWADSLSSLACALLQTLATGILARELGLPETLLLRTGYFLLVSGAIVAFLATRVRTPSAVIWALILGDAFWGVACIAVMLDAREIISLGKAYVLSQAIVAVGLAVLQYLGLRQNKTGLADRQIDQWHAIAFNGAAQSAALRDRAVVGRDCGLPWEQCPPP
jgi:hypothetical protein